MAGWSKKRKRTQKKADTTEEKPDKREVFETVRENEQFKAYYKSQNILPDEDFEKFYNILKTPLPSTFRITGSRSHAAQMLDLVENFYVPAMQDIEIDGVKVEPPKRLPWYPNGLGWQVNAPRIVIKRSPVFSKFHKFIVSETEAGNLSRQEAVSMVPPLLMDIKPHQWVLDMCAAPGSKTAQIIEAIHANDHLNEIPAGLVIANDADYRRSHMLIHQSKRLQSPCFVATNHDGAHFPNVHVTLKEGEKPVPLQFDRVLCDVPCSGDGTLRKNERLWAEWTNGGALSLHKIQVQIFLRGARLTKVGGKIVYSTCSFNPIENEAVVAEVLRMTNGALELLDVSDQLPELKRYPGLKTWKVMTKSGQYVESNDQVEGKKLPRSVFPPENVDQLPLERCIRIYPHQQDTGGFFVAVFQKVKPLTRAECARDAPSSDAQEECEESDVQNEASPETTEEAATLVPSKRPQTSESEPDEEEVKKSRVSKESPFELMEPTCDDAKQISAFYGLGAEFPTNQFLLRTDENAKNRTIYFVSQAVKTLLAAHDINRLNMVMTGVRMFVRQGSTALTPSSASAEQNDSMFRITFESVPLLEPFLSERRRVTLTDLDDLKVLFTKAYPMIQDFKPSTIEKLQAMDLGCCIFHFNIRAANASQASNENLVLPMSVPVWKGKVSLSLLMNKQDKRTLCQRIFDVIPETAPEHLIKRSLDNQQPIPASEESN